jgi:hypothetical protein
MNNEEKDMVYSLVEHTKQEARNEKREALVMMRKVYHDWMVSQEIEIPELFKQGDFIDFFVNN